MRAGTIFVAAVLTAAAVFLLCENETTAAEKRISSHGNLTYGDPLRIYSQDFSYLYHEIENLKGECY